MNLPHQAKALNQVPTGPVRPIPTGTITTIAGRVTGDSGNPVGGVRVTVIQYRGEGTQPPACPAQLNCNLYLTAGSTVTGKVPYRTTSWPAMGLRIGLYGPAKPSG